MQRQINTKSFEGQTVYVGIDVHLKTWQVSILCGEVYHKSFSQAPNALQLSSYLSRMFPGANYKAVYESGFSGFEACRQLRSLGIDCMVIHASDVPTTHKERQQKCDKSDSNKLAKSLRGGEIRGIDIPSRQLEADRSLLRQRYRLSKELARQKNRLKSLLHQFSIAIPERFSLQQSRSWSRPFIDWLKGLKVEWESLQQSLANYVEMGELLRKELLKINQQLRKLSQQVSYKQAYELLMSIPGIGSISAMNLLLQLGNIERFATLDELCSYVGLMPKMYESGDTRIIGKLVNRGRKDLKIMLIEASWVAMRMDPALLVKYQELIKTRHPNKAIIKIAKKVLSRIRYVLKNKVVYTIGVVK